MINSTQTLFGKYLLLVMIFTGIVNLSQAQFLSERNFDSEVKIAQDMQLNMGLVTDSVIHLVWDVEISDSPVTYVVERSVDGQSFVEIDRLVTSESGYFGDIKENIYGKIVVGRETGSWRAIYNDYWEGDHDLVYKPERLFRIRRIKNNDITYSMVKTTTRFDYRLFNGSERYLRLLKQETYKWQKANAVTEEDRPLAACPSKKTRPPGYDTWLETKPDVQCGNCQFYKASRWQKVESFTPPCGTPPCIDNCTYADGTPIHTCATISQCQCTPWPGCAPQQQTSEFTQIEIGNLNNKPTVNVKDQVIACGKNTALLCGTTTGNIVKYRWTPSQRTTACTNLGPGTYTLTVTDSRGCQASDKAVVSTTTVKPNVNVQNTTLACNTTTPVTANPTGASGPYTYKWSNGATTATTNYGGGTHSVEITSKDGCKKTTTFNINEIKPDANVVVHASPCTGELSAADARTSTAPTGATIASYYWIYDDGVERTDKQNDGVDWKIWSTNGAHEVKVVVTDNNGCVDTASTTLNVKKSPVPKLTKTDAGCGVGTSLGSATADYSGWWGTVSYEWSNGATTKTIDKLKAGWYTVTITGGNGCAVTDSIEIKQGGLGGSLPRGNVSCPDADDGWAKARPSGGDGNYSYEWKDNKGNVIGTDSTIANLAGGDYSVYVVDGKGCSITAPFTIEAPEQISGAMNQKNISCANPTGSISPWVVRGGQAPYKLWMASGQMKDNVDASDSTLFDGLPAGFDTLYIEDVNGCMWDFTIEIKQTGDTVDVFAEVLENAPCSGVDEGFAFASASGGEGPYTYIWDDPNNTTGDSLKNVASDTYIVTVTDKNGCTGTDTVTVESNSEMTVEMVASTTRGCDRHGAVNGFARVNVTGGTPPYSYSWNDPNNQQADSAVGLPQGTWVCTVTDIYGCTAQDSATIEPPLILDLSASGVSCETCTDGSATVNVSGSGTPPYTYRWDDENSQTTQTATGLKKGTYLVTVTDDEGCRAADTVSIDVGTGILNMEMLDKSLSVYPNPSNGSFVVEVNLPETENVFANIYDLTGKVIHKQRILNGVNQITSRDLTDGLYLLELSNGFSRITVRIQVM